MKWLIIDDIHSLNCDIIARTAREGMELILLPISRSVI